mgnify:CR=1 FL=1
MQEWINFLMKDTITQFGKKLREIRLKKELSQGDVSRILHVHRSYISGLERGMRNPSLLTVQKIARALGVNAKDLI